MKFKNIRLRAYLLFAFCSLSWFAVAQTNDNNDKKMLLGKWIWEEVSTPSLDSKYIINLDLKNDHIHLYDEIEIYDEFVFLKDDEKVQKIKYEVNESFIGLNFPLGRSFIAEWTVLEDKLYMEFIGSHPDEKSKKVKYLLVYKKNR